MFMTIEKYQKNWTFTIISDFGKYSVKIRSQPKFGRSIRFRFNRNRIFSNANSVSFKESRIVIWKYLVLVKLKPNWPAKFQLWPNFKRIFTEVRYNCKCPTLLIFFNCHEHILSFGTLTLMISLYKKWMLCTLKKYIFKKNMKLLTWLSLVY